MTARMVEATVTPDDVDASLERFLAGARIHLSCPVQRALQRTTDRVAVVYQYAWHLGEQDKVPATAGEPLPAAAVAFIAAFDTWAKAVRTELLVRGSYDQTAAAAAVKVPRPGALQFSVALPEKPMVPA